MDIRREDATRNDMHQTRCLHNSWRDHCGLIGCEFGNAVLEEFLARFKLLQVCRTYGPGPAGHGSVQSIAVEIKSASANVPRLHVGDA